MTEAVPTDAESSHRTKGLLRLTMACNEKCPFCNVPAEDYRQRTPPQAEIDRQLQTFIDQRAGTLTVSGGEPTLLRKRLLQLVRRARAGGIPLVEIQTNAVLIDADYAAELAEAGVTSAFVSLLSHRADDHDVLAGLEGAFPRCLRGIDALLDHGIRVALNPVLARRTQAHFADFVSFVADRLPRVTSISVSAVQPHGRAGRGDNPAELLPDYSVLAEQLPLARQRARAAGIELLNPYCGLPLCIGWREDPDRSVEAFEAQTGGWRPTPGVENRGDKRHGEPCRACAWRTRCGGAWHAYWDIREGDGIQPPARALPPWRRGPRPDQATIDARAGLTPTALRDVAEAVEPTVWLWVHHLKRGDALRLLDSGCTDLAVDLDPAGLAHRPPAATLVGLKELQRLLSTLHDRKLPASRQLRVHLRIQRSAMATSEDRAAALHWARQRPGLFAIRGDSTERG